MELGMIGLGRMGGNMAERLREAGHTVVGYDRDPKIADVASLEELVERLSAPRAVWVMVPAGAPTQETIHRLGELLPPVTWWSTAATHIMWTTRSTAPSSRSSTSRPATTTGRPTGTEVCATLPSAPE
jgi:3-hydroxyisobutyrate dehydrogenase-like beta-hydroxyacid dehydrogenase